MKSKSKKLMVAIVALCMLIMLFAACDKTKETTTEVSEATDKVNETIVDSKEEVEEEEAATITEEFVTVKTVMPGDISGSMEEFLKDEFALRMKEELNMAIDVYFSSWSDYWSKFPMMISAGEQVDFYWNPPSEIVGNYKNGLCVPVTEYYNKYGTALKEQLSPENVDAAYIDGEMIYIPTANNPTSNKFMSIMVRQDILEKIGMTKITTLEDFEEAATLIKSDPDLAGMNIVGAFPMPFMLRAFWDDSYYYTAAGLTAINLETNKVVFLPETEEFKEFLKTVSEWAKMGWIPEEVTLKSEETWARMQSGNYFMIGGGISDPMDVINDLRANVPEAELVEYIFNEDTMPKYKVLSCTDAIAFGATGEYPERTMMFINWLYESIDNFNFACYGIEGEDFVITEDKKIEQINTDSFFYPWMYINVDTALFRSDLPDTFIESYRNWDKGVIISDVFGITLNTENVATETAAINTAYTEKYFTYLTGFSEYDEAAVEGILESLKEDGLDTYLAELQRQVDEYIAD